MNKLLLPIIASILIVGALSFDNEIYAPTEELYGNYHIVSEGIAKCETEKNIFCGADSTQSQFRLKVIDVSKDSISGIAKGLWSHTHNEIIFYNGHSLKSDNLTWVLSSVPIGSGESGFVFTMTGPMYDDSGNYFKFEVKGFIDTKTLEQGGLMKSVVFSETTITRNDGRTLSEFSFGKSSFMDYSDDFALSVKKDNGFNPSYEKIPSNSVSNFDFNSSLHVSDIEGYPDIITNVKGITKCETEKTEFCGAFKTRTQLNFEITEISEKIISGTGTGKIVLDHPGDVLELYSDSLSLSSIGPHFDGGLFVKGLLYDKSGNSYEYETIGLILDDSDGSESVQFRNSESVYFESVIKDQKGHVFTVKELGRINTLDLGGLGGSIGGSYSYLPLR